MNQEEKIEVLEEENKNDTTKKKSKKILVGLLVIAVILIGLGIILNISNKTEENNDIDVTSKTAIKEEIKGTYTSYSGYSFLVPEGYTAEIKEGYGIIITDKKNVIYMIFTDYTNSYDMYKTKFTEDYPTEVDNIVTKVAKREYLALIQEENASSHGTMFVTKATNLTTFVGMVVRSDYTSPTAQEFKVLTSILNNTKQEEQQEDLTDFGKDGIKVIGYKKENYTFEK